MKQALGLLIIMGGGFIIYSALTNKAWVQALTGGASTTSGNGAFGMFGTNAPTSQQTSTVFGGTQNNVSTTGHGYTP